MSGLFNYCVIDYNVFMLTAHDWLLLKKAPKLGNRGLLKALEYFGSPSEIFSASFTTLKASKLFHQQTIDWLQAPDTDAIAADIEWAQGENCHLLTLADERYPKLLKQITDPPPVLYAKGDLSLLTLPQIAIVGSRNPTQGGVENASLFSSQLTQYQLGITSGLALGIDAAAHISALEAGGKTIAVCGTGLDRVYPASHKNLAHQIANSGLLISEFAIGTPPMAQNFPRRNRVISGLTMGTLVVEATLKSGSLITARLAAEQGREVFAIPSSIRNSKAQGSHLLIQQGAKLVQTIDDIIEELAEVKIRDNTQPVITEADNLSDDEINNNEILKYLSYDSKGIDELVELSQLSVEVINQQLMHLELANQIERVHGSGFILRKA